MRFQGRAEKIIMQWSLVLMSMAVVGKVSGEEICSAEIVDYVGDGEHEMIIYEPKGLIVGAVLYFPGSGWCGTGPRSDPCPEILGQGGIACAAAGYSAGSWPRQHREARAALRYIHARYTNTKIGVIGHSSGSSLASFLWAAERVPDGEVDFGMLPPLGQYPNASIEIDAAVLMSGQFHPYPINTPSCTEAEVWNKTLENSACEFNYTLGSFESAQRVNPTFYLATQNPAPALLFHGTNDTLVSACNAVELSNAADMVSSNYSVHLRLIKGASHTSYLDNAYPIAAAFFAKHLVTNKNNVDTGSLCLMSKASFLSHHNHFSSASWSSTISDAPRSQQQQR